MKQRSVTRAEQWQWTRCGNTFRDTTLPQASHGDAWAPCLIASLMRFKDVDALREYPRACSVYTSSSFCLRLPVRSRCQSSTYDSYWRLAQASPTRVPGSVEWKSPPLMVSDGLWQSTDNLIRFQELQGLRMDSFPSSFTMINHADNSAALFNVGTELSLDSKIGFYR